MTLRCRMFGHDWRGPNGWKIHFFVPSAEGSGRRVIATCARCGAKWERR